MYEDVPCAVLFAFNIKYIMKRQLLFVGIIMALASCNRETFDDRVCRQTNEYSRTSCPKSMDKYTVLDSMVYHPDGRIMTYHYSVSDKMDVDSIYTPTMTSLFDASLLNNIRHNPGLKELKEHKITFSYIYASRTNGTVYMTFTYAPDRYVSVSK